MSGETTANSWLTVLLLHFLLWTAVARGIASIGLEMEAQVFLQMTIYSLASRKQHHVELKMFCVCYQTNPADTISWMLTSSEQRDCRSWNGEKAVFEIFILIIEYKTFHSDLLHLVLFWCFETQLKLTKWPEAKILKLIVSAHFGFLHSSRYCI